MGRKSWVAALAAVGVLVPAGVADAARVGGTLRFLAAARFGKARLIDNVGLELGP